VADENQSERAWIVEPPGPGEVAVHFSVGEGTELTERQEAALGELLRSLEAHDDEVTGFAAASNFNCSKYYCTGVNCKDLGQCDIICTNYTLPKIASAGGSPTWSLSMNLGL
jgi:hypothetical protein